jgi:dienelactone hydrolase
MSEFAGNFTKMCLTFYYYGGRAKKIMLKPIVDRNAPWKQRFRETVIAGAQIAGAKPDQGLVTSTQSGQYQLFAWNVSSNSLLQLTFNPDGTVFGLLSPDGRYVYYLEDKNGNEMGHFVRIPWIGGEPEDITPDLPPYSAFGLSMSRTGNILGGTFADDNGFHTRVMTIGTRDIIGPIRELHHSRKMMFGPTLSYDGQIGVVTSTDRSAFQHNGLISFNTTTGKALGELWHDGSSIMAFGFSPLPGDFRLLATATKTGYNRPFIWNPVSGETTELHLPDISGDVSVMDWSPDGKRILLARTHQAKQNLLIYELTTGKRIELKHPGGFYGMGMTFAPTAHLMNGEILAGWQDAANPPQLIALDSLTGRKKRTVLPADPVPPGRPWKNITFKSTDGQIIQGWLGLPQGKGPFPTILHTHGGPETATVEYFMPNSQAWLDHGFAWLAINYRGSTGFGRQFREKIWGDIGHWEVEDMVAARQWLVEQDIAIPEQVFLTGWSYGGYLTLLALGKFPDLWAGGLAGTATVDWAMEYEDLSYGMRGYSVALMGGTPQEKPELYAAASPMRYIEKVKAPVLIIQGLNDTRTPPRPVMVYEAKLKELGKKIEVHWFQEGHLGGGTEQDIEHMEIMLRFAYRVLGESTFTPHIDN